MRTIADRTFTEEEDWPGQRAGLQPTSNIADFIAADPEDKQAQLAIALAPSVTEQLVRRIRRTMALAFYWLYFVAALIAVPYRALVGAIWAAYWAFDPPHPGRFPLRRWHTVELRNLITPVGPNVDLRLQLVLEPNLGPMVPLKSLAQLADAIQEVDPLADRSDVATATLQLLARSMEWNRQEKIQSEVTLPPIDTAVGALGITINRGEARLHGHEFLNPEGERS